MEKVVISKPQQERSQVDIILTRFLDGESVEDIAEDYRVNCLMIEEVLRSLINKIMKT